MRVPIGILTGLLLLTTRPAAPEVDLLRRLIDVNRLTRPPAERSVIVAGRADQAKPAEEGWRELLALDGPGLITRIWIERPAGRLRIVLDDKPAFDAETPRLFDGSHEPFTPPLVLALGDSKAGECRVPLAFARRCRILARELSGSFVIDAVRLSGPLRPAQSADPTSVREALRRGLDRRQRFGDAPMTPYASQEQLKPGRKLTLTVKQPGTIRTLLVSFGNRVMPRERFFAHRVVLRCYWDGHARPDVEVPLAEFCGTGFDRNLFNSLLAGTNRWEQIPFATDNESWFLYSFFPMPFNRARIEIENLNRNKTSTLSVFVAAFVDRDPPPADALRFRAACRVVRDPARPRLRLADVWGPGWLVGWTLNVDVPDRRDWAAAHVLIDPDGALTQVPLRGFFGLLDAGRPLVSPLSGTTLRGPFGRNSMYRWLIADAIAFSKRLTLTLDLSNGGGAKGLYVGSVVYWYAPSGAGARVARLDASALDVPPLRIPGAVEIEGNIRGSGWGRIYRLRATDRFELSGSAAALVRTDKPVHVLLPVRQAGRYKLRLRTRPGRSFKPITVKTAAGQVIGVVEYRRTSDAVYDVGEVELKPGDNELIVQCGGPTYLDCWVLERIGP